jgi:ATP-dependent Clp protease ATP-binding subunit ClpC
MHHLSKRAEQILKLASEVAREYGQGHVGTEHLLLAIWREGTGSGAKILREHGVTDETLRAETNKVLQDRLQETWVLGRLPGTRHFRDVLSKAANAAKGQGNWQICSVHLLVALLQERESCGYRILRGLGVSVDTVRAVVVRQASVAVG